MNNESLVWSRFELLNSELIAVHELSVVMHALRFFIIQTVNYHLQQLIKVCFKSFVSSIVCFGTTFNFSRSQPGMVSPYFTYLVLIANV